MLEAEFTRIITNRLNERGVFSFAVVGGGSKGKGPRQRSGMPDRAYFWRGHTFWCEFKGKTTVMSRLQQLTMREMWRRDVPAGVVRLVDEKKELLHVQTRWWEGQLSWDVFVMQLENIPWWEKSFWEERVGKTIAKLFTHGEFSTV